MKVIYLKAIPPAPWSRCEASYTHFSENLEAPPPRSQSRRFMDARAVP